MPLFSNKSIKTDPVQTAVKDYLRLHHAAVRSVWSNVVSIVEYRRQVDSLSANSIPTALTLSLFPRSLRLMTVESMPKGTFSIRESRLEMVSQLLCVTNYKRHGDYPLTFLMRISMIDTSVSWYSYNLLAFHAFISLLVFLSVYRILHFYLSFSIWYIALVVKKKTYQSCETAD